MSRLITTIAALALSLTATACLRVDFFTCAESSECGASGVCEAGGSCSFPDSECPSGRRFGEFAAEELSGACVPGEASATTGATDPSETSEPGSGTTDGGCAQVGGSCSVDADCCSDCMACDAGVCVALEGDREPCGECQACDAQGVCVDQASGAPCDADCSRYLWGAETSEALMSCYRIAEAAVEGTCDASGLCVATDVSTCPEERGEAVVTCSASCVVAETDCAQGAPAATITLESFCALDQETSECTLACGGELGAPVATQSRCDLEGMCEQLAAEDCFPYACDGPICGSGCSGQTGCAEAASCMAGACMPD